MKELDLEAYVRGITALKRAGRLEEALCSLINLSIELTERESTFGRIFGSPQLDAATAMLGLVRRRIRLRNRRGVVVIATALYRRGGHTRSLLDLLAADRRRPVTVLLTNVGHDLALREMKEILPNNVGVEIAPGVGLAQRMRWLQKRLENLRPERTYLFHHPYDAIAVAAAQPSLVGRLYFYHHADHGFTLGLHGDCAAHIDPTPKIYHHCRERERLNNNVYWPLTAGSIAYLKPSSRRRRTRGLVTCCSGGIEKFEGVALVDRLPYRPNYPEVVATILSTTRGQHLHIGPLSDAMVQQIEEKLRSRGLGTRAFIHVRETESVPDELARHEVGIYLGSFPRGGGRALVEAMSLGLPLLLHDSYRSTFMTDINEAYEGALTWRTLPELGAALSSVTQALLATHRKLSREAFENAHSFSQFENAVAATISGEMPEAPALRTHLADELQNYVDEQNRIEFDTSGTDLLKLMRERNEGWKSLGGITIDDVETADPLHYGLLPSKRGVYVHAGPKRRMTLVRISPEEGHRVLGMRAVLELPDKRCPSVEYALAITRGDGSLDLAGIAKWLDRREPTDTRQYQLAAHWQLKADRETEAVTIDWREREPAAGVVIALRAVDDDNRYAFLNFTNIEWKATASSREDSIPMRPGRS